MDTQVKPGGAETRLPAVLKPEGASAKALEMLNGRSIGSTEVWKPSKGDYLLGEIRDISMFEERFTRREVARLELLVSEGTEGGLRFEPSSHRVILCVHEELRRMVQKLQPRVADVLCLAYLGRDDVSRTSRHLYRYSIERARAGNGDDAGDNSF